jgi:hypothetical protein
MRREFNPRKEPHAPPGCDGDCSKFAPGMAAAIG